ncbi:fimbrial biogenesis chaperone [Lelliottia wanjuensis]|uniref:fimbrial biogenesis chaperone n=1 Tax=Lelliottia wanjuensis TaxID=3050585 RepID=UPI0036F43130
MASHQPVDFYSQGVLMSLIKKFFLLSVLFSASTATIAGVTIAGTRIIFPGNEREVSVRTNNKGKLPALVQVWIDDGKANEDINQVKTPFIITPPVYRVEQGKGQSLRLIYTGMALPQDRESLFWFNLLEIPPVVKSEDKSKNHLDLAFRTRIKIFWRPATLEENSVKTFKRLKWVITSDSKKGTGIQITNPTGYYFSFDTGTFTQNGKKYDMNMDMVAPGATETWYANNGSAAGGNVTQISVKLLNDYGSPVEKILINQPGKGYVEQQTE